MRKIIFTISFLVLAYFGYSQVSFGLKSGTNIATVKDINRDPKNRVGWYGGAFLTTPIYKKIFFQPELLFSAKGYSDYGTPNVTKKTAVRLNYITAPLLFRYKIDHKTSLFLGPEFGYLLSVYQKTPFNQTYNLYYNFPVKLDIEMAVGLNYKILTNAGIEIRYTYGFKNIYTRDNAGVRFGDLLAGNRVFQLGAFYSFFVK